jgi:hypothetical protein
MKKFLRLGVIIISLFLIAVFIYGSIGTTYQAQFPCADCQGIKATLTLYLNHTYKEKYIYQGKNRSFEEIGQWQKIPNSPKDTQNIYFELIPYNKGGKKYYRLQNDILIPLDNQLNQLSTPFDMSLKKIK